MNDGLDQWFHDTASALAYSIASERKEADQSYLQPPYNDITQFILLQHARMASFLRAPLKAATLGFDLFAILNTGSRFHKLPPDERARQITAWKSSGIGFQRDLIRYFESLTLLELYSRQQASVPPRTEDHIAPSPDELQEHVVSSPPAESSYEVVVIGSGPGGAITACLLAEAGRNVLLIEEGEYLRLNSCIPFSREEMVQKYRNGGQTVAMGENKVAYVEGRCVGGGSEINSGLYHRTPPAILENWRREFQVEGLFDADLNPHFEACEKEVSVSLLPGPAPTASLKLHEGATRLGWKSLEIPRWFRYEPGAAGGSTGKRQSMTETFIPRFLNSGGKLLPQTRVETIRQDGPKWIINAHHAAGELRISAGALFICAGAVQTPALLRRSGITKNIGDSLRLHPTVKVVARFPEAINSEQMGVPVHQVKEFAPQFSFGCSISTPPYLALALADHPSQAHKVARDWPHMATYYSMITGEGQGSVRCLPRVRDPLVRYRLTDNDRRDLSDGLRKLCLALFESGAKALYPSITRGAHFQTHDDLTKLPNTLPTGLTNLMTIHLFSSCPMGENQSKCATNSFGQVHGFKNLFVNDASLLCTAPGVNPQGSVMAFARRNTLKFLNVI